LRALTQRRIRQLRADFAGASKCYSNRSSAMPGKKKHGNVKNSKKYEALRRKGMSKSRAAKITNAGKKGSRKGGKNSHKKKS
jgi:hypothetical protein